MKMAKGEIFISRSDDIQPAEFSVSLVDDERDCRFPSPEHIYHPIFEGDSRIANTLFGWAIAVNLKDRENDVMLLFNGEDDLVLPEGYKIKAKDEKQK